MGHYRTCTHIYDNGRVCNSAAVTGRNYCAYHLRFRARQLRMAQMRARGQTLTLKLPPLEDLMAVQSAVTQVVEALAAGMLDARQGRAILTGLRLAAQNLRNAEKWQSSVYYMEEPAAAVDVAAEFGLPEDLDLDTPPEAAFPEALPDPVRGDLSSPASGAATTEVEAAAPSRFPAMPTVAWCKHGPGCPEHTIRADYPVTPERAELDEIVLTQGGDAAVVRSRQLDRNWERRQLRKNRQRYAAIAMERNVALAVERLAEQKLAEVLKASGSDAPAAKVDATAKKPSASVGGNEQMGGTREEVAV